MRAPGVSEIRLKISMSQDEFFYFEPVKWTCASPAAERKVFTNRLDPSHETFAIWITKPDGERFRYHPGISVCAPMKHRTISRRNSFRRDISIFRHGSGFTFSTPGAAKVQTVMTLTKHLSIFSNEICCEVIKPNPRAKLYAEMKKAFSSIEAIRFLRYKRRLPSNRVIQDLKRFAERHRSAPSAAAVHYALGRAFLPQVKNRANGNGAQKRREKGLLHYRKRRNTAEI